MSDPFSNNSPSENESLLQVLHIDDDPAVTRVVHALLRPYSIITSPLNDPTQAVDQLLRDQHRVVLLDISMPGIDGIELLKQIKRLDGGINVIMLTGVVTMSTVLRSNRYGASACLFKPVLDVGPLVEAIHSSFANLDRWWRSLKELREMRQEEVAHSY